MIAYSLYSPGSLIPIFSYCDVMRCDVIRGENPKQHEVAGHMMVLGISKHTSAILSTNFANNL